MLNKFAIAIAATVTAFCVTSLGQAQGLTGSHVTGGVYCCRAPTADYLGTNLVTETVGPAVEFPNGVFRASRGGSVIPVTIDVTDSTIDILFSRRSIGAPGAFNGYILDFAGAPEITGISLDPLSTVNPTSLTWDSNTVFVSFASRLLPADSRVLINVLAVPEPTTSAMLLGGIGLLGFCGWRRAKPPVSRPNGHLISIAPEPA